MLDLSQWIVFVGACLALVAVPGPAVLFIVARSAAGGRRTGLVTAAGIGLGNLTHAVGAAFGVSAVVASTPWAIELVRYLGAAYLIYLGGRSLLGAEKGSGQAKAAEGGSDFVKGIFVALLNPKVILFLLAFLPQFVDAQRGEVWAQLLALGIVFVFIGWIGDSSWALLAGVLTARFRKGGGAARWTRVVPAMVFIVLGLATALSALGA